MNKLILILTLISPLAACATSMTDERKDYVLSRPHGFIEITITDNYIPNVLSRKNDKKVLQRPSSCYLSVRANSEPIFSQLVFPDGSEPPYKVDSGFRFPIPLGNHDVTVTYDSCRASNDGEAESIKASTHIVVQKDMVYEIQFFDGQIANVQEKQDDFVTLKRILEAIEK